MDQSLKTYLTYFFLFKTEIDEKNRLLYLYLNKDCFQSFFNLNIE